MTPCEWASCIDGYKLREEDAWQRTRLIYALIYNTNVDKHHQMKPEELIPLPSDKKVQELHTSVRYLTEEERQEVKKRYKLD